MRKGKVQRDIFQHQQILEVKPHGVLGTMEGDKDLMPLSPIEAGCSGYPKDPWDEFGIFTYMNG